MRFAMLLVALLVAFSFMATAQAYTKHYHHGYDTYSHPSSGSRVSVRYDSASTRVYAGYSKGPYYYNYGYYPYRTDYVYHDHVYSDRYYDYPRVYRYYPNCYWLGGYYHCNY